MTLFKDMLLSYNTIFGINCYYIDPKSSTSRYIIQSWPSFKMLLHQSKRL